MFKWLVFEHLLKTLPTLLTLRDMLRIYLIGEFVDFERRGEDVPKKATLDDLLNVMISFDKKAEKIVGVLGEIKNDTALIPAIKENTEKMLEKQDRMLEKQDSMLEKQDTTIDILKGVKGDTAQILQHTSKIPMIAENTSLIPAIKEDTSEIKTNTREVVDKLQNKYEELSREIAQMKITLSKIEAKVFS